MRKGTKICSVYISTLKKTSKNCVNSATVISFSYFIMKLCFYLPILSHNILNNYSVKHDNK